MLRRIIATQRTENRRQGFKDEAHQLIHNNPLAFIEEKEQVSSKLVEPCVSTEEQLSNIFHLVEEKGEVLILELQSKIDMLSKKLAQDSMQYGVRDEIEEACKQLNAHFKLVEAYFEKAKTDLANLSKKVNCQDILDSMEINLSMFLVLGQEEFKSITKEVRNFKTCFLLLAGVLEDGVSGVIAMMTVFERTKNKIASQEEAYRACQAKYEDSLKKISLREPKLAQMSQRFNFSKSNPEPKEGVQDQPKKGFCCFSS